VLKGIDQDNDKIKFDVVSEPLMGVLVGFDKHSGTVMYVPNPGSDGTDRFTFRAIDIHNLQSNVAEVLVIVNTIQDTGHKLADVNAATSSNEPVIITVKASNHESGSYLKFDIVSGPSHGKLTKFTNIDYDTATVKYTPDDDYSGNDMFDFRAFDTSSGSNGLSDIATASITVIVDPPGKNPLPLASPQSSDTDVTSIARRISSDAPIIKDKPVMNNEPEQAKSQSSTFSTNPIIINNNPSVNAGLDRSVYEGTNGVTLKGTGKDTDHNALRYSWEQTGGDSVVLNDANTPKPTFNAPDVDEDKVLTFKLTVVDEKGGQGSDDVKIRIKDKPVMNSQIANDQFYRDRNPNSPNFNVTSLQAH
jgi:hypothetical protein